MPKIDIYSRPLNEEIYDRKLKLRLLDSDRKAYRENLNEALSDCKKRVSELRKENNRLRKDLHEKLKADDHIINQAFQGKPEDKCILSNKKSHVANDLLNDKVAERSNKWNLLKYETDCKIKKLENVLNNYESLNLDINYIENTNQGLNEEGQEIRNIENRLDKAIFKCSEASHLNKTYAQIRNKMKEEHMHYGNDLDNLESEIKKCRKQLCQLKVLNNDSIIARDSALNELRKKEIEIVYERKKREKEIAQMKTNLDENLKLKMDYRKESEMSENEISYDFQISDEQKAKLTKYEQYKKEIQDITGALNLKEAIIFFSSQKKTEENLKSIIERFKAQCLRMKKEKIKLKNTYSKDQLECDTKTQKYEDTIMDIENYLDMSELKKREIKKKLDTFFFIITICKLCTQNLIDNIPCDTQKSASLKDKNSIVDHMIVLEEKLDMFLEDIQEPIIYNKVSILESFQDFHSSITKTVQPNNTRVNLDKFNIDEQESPHGIMEEDSILQMRIQLKLESQIFLDLKTKKNVTKKKKNKEK